MKGSKDFIKFDELHPHPLRSLTYYPERVRAHNVHTASAYHTPHAYLEPSFSYRHQNKT